MTQPSIEISAKQFAALVRPVVPLASTDAMLPAINSVHFELLGDYLTACATDRYQVGMMRVRLDEPPKKLPPFTLRLSVIREIQKIFKADRWTDPALKITPTGESVVIEQVGGIVLDEARIKFPCETADYPKIAGVITTSDRGTPGTFAVDANRLANFRHAITDATGLVVHPSDGSKVVIVTAGDDFIGAIMPRRHEVAADLEGWSTFLAPLAPAEKKAVA